MDNFEDPNQENDEEKSLTPSPPPPEKFSFLQDSPETKNSSMWRAATWLAIQVIATFIDPTLWATRIQNMGDAVIEGESPLKPLTEILRSEEYTVRNIRELALKETINEIYEQWSQLTQMQEEKKRVHFKDRDLLFAKLKVDLLENPPLEAVSPQDLFIEIQGSNDLKQELRAICNRKLMPYLESFQNVGRGAGLEIEPEFFGYIKQNLANVWLDKIQSEIFKREAADDDSWRRFVYRKMEMIGHLVISSSQITQASIEDLANTVVAMREDISKIPEQDSIRAVLHSLGDVEQALETLLAVLSKKNEIPEEETGDDPAVGTVSPARGINISNVGGNVGNINSNNIKINRGDVNITFGEGASNEGLIIGGDVEGTVAGGNIEGNVVSTGEGAGFQGGFVGGDKKDGNNFKAGDFENITVNGGLFAPGSGNTNVFGSNNFIFGPDIPPEDAIKVIDRGLMLLDGKPAGQVNLKVAQLYTNKGQIFKKLGDVDEALLNFIEAKRLIEQVDMLEHPSASKPLKFLAQSFARLGMHEEAIETLELVLKMKDPLLVREDTPRYLIYQWIGLEFKELGNLQKAIENMNISLSLAKEMGADEEIIKSLEEYKADLERNE